MSARRRKSALDQLHGSKSDTVSSDEDEDQRCASQIHSRRSRRFSRAPLLTYEERLNDIVARTRDLAFEFLDDDENSQEEDEDINDEEKEFVRQFSNLLNLPRILSHKSMRIITDRVLNETADLEEKELIDEFVDEEGDDEEEEEEGKEEEEVKVPSYKRQDMSIVCPEPTETDLQQLKTFNEVNLLRSVSSKGFECLKKEVKAVEDEEWREQVIEDYVLWIQSKVKKKAGKTKRSKGKKKPRWQLLFEQHKQLQEESRK